MSGAMPHGRPPSSPSCARARPDPTLHLLRALATFRIAGPAATRKALAEGAAAPPATIDQQDALFTLQMSLDDLDGATRTLERLRALSPPELQLLHYEVGLAMTRQDWTALAALQERLRSHGDSGAGGADPRAHPVGHPAGAMRPRCRRWSSWCAPRVPRRPSATWS
jgi:hypothetical protein